MDIALAYFLGGGALPTLLVVPSPKQYNTPTLIPPSMQANIAFTFSETNKGRGYSSIKNVLHEWCKIIKIFDVVFIKETLCGHKGKIKVPPSH